MAAGCLTKNMKCYKLKEVLDGWLDLKATTESMLTKLRKQKLRKKKTEEEPAGDTEPITYSDGFQDTDQIPWRYTYFK